MGLLNERLSESLGLVGAIYPPAAGLASGATTSSGAIDLSKGSRFLATTIIGVLAGSSSISGFWSGCSTAGGTYTALATGGFAATTTGSQTIECDITPAYVQTLGLGYNFLKWNLAVTVATANASAIVQLGAAREEPASNQNIASVSVASSQM